MKLLLGISVTLLFISQAGYCGDCGKKKTHLSESTKISCANLIASFLLNHASTFRDEYDFLMKLPKGQRPSVQDLTGLSAIILSKINTLPQTKETKKILVVTDNLLRNLTPGLYQDDLSESAKSIADLAALTQKRIKSLSNSTHDSPASSTRSLSNHSDSSSLVRESSGSSTNSNSGVPIQQ